MTIQGLLIANPLTQADYEAMKRHTRIWRDTLLLMLLRNSGFRPIEVENLQVAHFEHQGQVYFVAVRRTKNRSKDNPFDALFISPNLGQPLTGYIRGQRLKPTDSIFGIRPRQLRNMVEAAGLAAISRLVQPREYRRFFIRTVAQFAASVLGFAPQHLQVAQKMVGHESVRSDCTSARK
jgi:integrase